MEAVETDAGLQVAGAATDTGEQPVIAAMDQLFTGLTVDSSSESVRCALCPTHLHEGEEVSVYAYRTVETPRWYLARWNCLACGSQDISTPTLGVTEARIRARLSTVNTVDHLCLLSPSVTAVSHPTEGTP